MPEKRSAVRPSALRGSALRYHALAELLRAVQEAAFHEWNRDPARPAWDREGRLARRVYSGPLDADRLLYLSERGRAEFREKIAQVRARRTAERKAVRLLRQLANWEHGAAAQVESMAHDDGLIGPAMNLLREMVPQLGAVRAWRRVTLFRKDSTRGDLAVDTAQLLKLHGKDATSRDMALASILCGLFPETLKLGREGCTVAEAIGAEVRLMRTASRHRAHS